MCCSSSKRRSKLRIGRSISKVRWMKFAAEPWRQNENTVQSEHQINRENSPEDRILRTDPLRQPIKTVTQSRRSSQRRMNQTSSITTVITTSEKSDSINHDGYRNVGQIIYHLSRGSSLRQTNQIAYSTTVIATSTSYQDVEVKDALRAKTFLYA